MMNTSTVLDIQDNIEELTRVAHILITKPNTDEDWWHNYIIGDKEYDINIFSWESDDGEPITIATAYPVTYDDSGYGTTDMTNFTRLVTQSKNRE
jgi:hypothetical protein